ncbi:MAG TPA: RNA-binding protein [Syntrophales bacterium]|jgi:RNA recognition motif-containing protein|nr:RNA-binding protein [Syntrophales bacterium]HRT61283.1 RNA-binding protein [Syntrophales bacterium]
MAKKLYVGNLSNDVTEEDLKTHFSTLGNVMSATIIRDKLTGMGKGFGFVEMETDEAAREAIGKLSGSSLRGKTIVVNEARPRKDQGGPRRDSRGGGGFRGGPGRMGGGGGGRRY